MATHTGNEGTVKTGSNAFAEIRSYSLNIEGETADTTTFASTGGWRTHSHTLKSWSGELECFWDETDTNGQVSLDAGDSITLNLYPEGDSTGDNYYTGTATVTAIEVSASVDGIVEAKFSFQGSGALTRGNVA